jgi:hypothetical protein
VAREHLAPLDVARARALRHARTGSSALDSVLTPNRGEKHVFGRSVSSVFGVRSSSFWSMTWRDRLVRAAARSGVLRAASHVR